jgi:nicotinamidase-related amidase
LLFNKIKKYRIKINSFLGRWTVEIKKGGKKTRHLLEKNIAVILVDMQENFVKKLRKGEQDRIIPNQLAVLRRCRELSIPVVALELRSEVFGKTVEIIRKEVSENPSGCIMEKEYNDGFLKSNLAKHLKSLKVENIFLMGINADYCVRDTAYGAISHGFKIMTGNHVLSGQSGHSRNNSCTWFTNNGTWIRRIDRFIEKKFSK